MARFHPLEAAAPRAATATQGSRGPRPHAERVLLRPPISFPLAWDQVTDPDGNVLM